ncbi:MAG: 2-deoxyribose-5-phosphate aldolase, partial [Gemmatimonadota bacterium]
MTFVRDNARIADFIDHTLLKAEATAREIDKLCDEAREHRFAAVCVNPVWVRRSAERLRGTPVQVATV